MTEITTVYDIETYMNCCKLGFAAGYQEGEFYVRAVHATFTIECPGATLAEAFANVASKLHSMGMGI